MISAQETGVRPGPGWGRLGFGLGCFAVAWVVWHIGWLPAHIFNATRFILYDQGSTLYVVDRMEQGAVLYRDLNWQYGPLAAGWYWGWAGIAGNLPLVQVLASASLMVLAWWQLGRLAIEVMGRRAGLPWVLAGLLPVMSPSGLIALNGPHGALEMGLLAAIAWVVAKVDDRHRRAWLLGLLIGLLQWVRFGPHAVAFLALVAVEGWGLRTEDGIRSGWWRQMGGWLGRVLVAYAVMWLALVAWYHSVLPWPGMVEQLWPSHMKEHYAATYAQRWPSWPDALEWVTRWLPILVGLAGAIAWGGAARKPASAAHSAPSRALAGLVFGPLYWLIGVLLLFRNDYTLIGHLWLVWPGIAVAWYLSSPKLRIGLVALLLPALVGHGFDLVRTWREERAWMAEPQTMPNGQRLWFRPAEARRFAELGAALGGNPRGKKLAVFIAGGGVHHFYGTETVGRHWWYLPGFVRPWEAATAEQALLQHEYLFVADFGQDQGASGVLKLWVPLPDDMGQRLLSRLTQPHRIEGLGYVLRIQPARTNERR